MKDQIKNLRLGIDSLAQFTGNIHTDTLFFAKAWLGKLLGEFSDSPSPYKDGKKSIGDIEPTSDRFIQEESPVDTIFSTRDWDPMNKVERIDYLRVSIGKLSEIVRVLTDLPSSREAAICRTQAWVYLCEARFYLGFELESMREDALASAKQE